MALIVSALATVMYINPVSALEKIAVAVIVLPPVPLLGVAVKVEITIGVRDTLTVREEEPYLPVTVALLGCERPELTAKN